MTTIQGTTRYVDLIPAGRKLYLSGGFFDHKNITTEIASISCVQIGSQVNMPSAVFHGILGTALAGLMGTIIGVATAKNDAVVKFVITFKKGSELKKITVETSDKILTAWLCRYIKEERK